MIKTIVIKPPTLETAWQDSTATLQITVTAQDGVTPIPGSSLTSCTFSLYDKDTRTIINERTNVDIQSDVNSEGILTLNLTELDNVIISTNEEICNEYHIAQITYTASISGISKIMIVDFLFIVERRFIPHSPYKDIKLIWDVLI